MPLPSSINDLSTTPASNSPAGSESSGLTDDYLRYHASYIASLRDVVISGTSSLTTLNLAYTGTLTGGTGVVNLGSGQFYKDSSGNVGIGVTPAAASLPTIQMSNGTTLVAPTNEFYLNQNATYNAGWKYLSTGYAAQYNIDQGTGTHHWNTAVSGTVGNAVSFAERMRLTNDGFLGIGTVSPQANFVVSNGSASGLEIAPAGGLSSGPAITSYNRTTAAYMPCTNYALNHMWWVGNFGRAMDLDANGNLGIGTAAPGTQLDVAKAQAGSTTIRVGNSSSANGASAQIHVNSDATDIKLAAFSSLTTTLGSQSWIYTTTATPLVFATQSNERMRITSAGDVGIGVTNPSSYTSAKMVVAGTGEVNQFIITDSASNTNFRGVAFGQTGSSTVYGSVRMQVNSGELRVDAGYAGYGGFSTFYTNGVERMRLDTNGNAMVGVTATTGSITNSTKLVQGIATSYNGTVSAATATTTTMFAVSPTSFNTYLVTVTVSTIDVGAAYTVLGLLRCASTTTSYTNILTATNLTVSLSAGNLQVTQASGLTQTVNWSLLRLI